MVAVCSIVYIEMGAWDLRMRMLVSARFSGRSEDEMKADWLRKGVGDRPDAIFGGFGYWAK